MPPAIPPVGSVAGSSLSRWTPAAVPVASRPPAEPPRQDKAHFVYASGATASQINGGPGTDVVCLPGPASDWVANGAGSYTSKINPAVKVVLHGVEAVRFYDIASGAGHKRQIDTEA